MRRRTLLKGLAAAIGVIGLGIRFGLPVPRALDPKPEYITAFDPGLSPNSSVGWVRIEWNGKDYLITDYCGVTKVATVGLPEWPAPPGPRDRFVIDWNGK